MTDEKFSKNSSWPEDGNFTPNTGEDMPSDTSYEAKEVNGEEQAPNPDTISSSQEAGGNQDNNINTSIDLRTRTDNPKYQSPLTTGSKPFSAPARGTASRGKFTKEEIAIAQQNLSNKQHAQNLQQPSKKQSNKALEPSTRVMENEEKYNFKQGENLSIKEAYELFSYNDVLSDDEKRPVSTEYDKNHPNKMKYAKELQALVSEYGLEKVMKTAKDLREECNVFLKKMGIKPTKYAGSISWSLWDIAKQSYYFKHPNERSEDYNAVSHAAPNNMVPADPLGEGYNSERKRTEIVDRHIGWEADVAYREGRFTKKAEEIEIGLEFATKHQRNETGQLKSFEYTHYGQRLRMLYGYNDLYRNSDT